MHPIQQAFVDYGAVQCGFCTPGMVTARKALLDKTPDPTEDQIRSALRACLKIHVRANRFAIKRMEARLLRLF